MNLSNWIQAIRPKTLPLSVSGILVGMSLAHFNLVLSDVERDYWLVFSFSISTTLLFQITSNLANDYADFMKNNPKCDTSKDEYDPKDDYCLEAR